MSTFAMARKGKQLVISADDFETLTTMSRSTKLDYRYVIRSRIILKLYEGKSYDEVQQDLSLGREVVAKWKFRFIQDGLEGLKDRPGRGKKPIFTEVEKAIVLSVDEKTRIQALDRSQPELPLKSGKPKRLTATYKRNGTVSLIAALAVHQGEITAETIDKNNHQNFLKFIKKLYRKHPKKQLHIIVDNLNVHKHHKVKEWVDSKKRVSMHFTPAYSSWLNQIEIWFNILSKDVLKGGLWHSKQQLINQLLEYIDTYNQTRAKPFQWTYKKNSSPFKKSLD